MQQIHHCSAPPRLTRTPRRHNRLDDRDFLCLSFELTKAHVAGVSRASKAFDMSVQDNVALGQSTPPNYRPVTRGEVTEACEAALMLSLLGVFRRRMVPSLGTWVQI